MDEALRLLREGASVLPIGPNKRPRLASWRELQERHPTVDELRSWWRSGASTGIGIVCGPISNITVLDIEHTALDVLDPFEVPETAIARSQRGGVHIYFRWVDGLGTRVIASEGRHVGELRGAGSYIACPPTPGRFGPYTWLVRRPLNELPPPPAWVLALPEGRDPLPPRPAKRAVSPPSTNGLWPSRSEEDLSIALSLANAGFDDEHITASLLQRPSVVDRGPGGWGYVQRTITRARSFSTEVLRDAVVSGVIVRDGYVEVTLQVLGRDGGERHLPFDWPLTERSRPRWEALVAAARALVGHPLSLRGARLRVEWFARERGHRVGRFYPARGR